MKSSISIHFKKRWKYYLGGYIFGYIFPLIMDGYPNMYYLIPIKLTGIIFALILGNAFYYAVNEKPTVFKAMFISLKIVIPVVILMILTFLLKKFLYKNYGIDITPFIGFN